MRKLGKHKISPATQQALARLQARGVVDLGAAVDVTRNGSGAATEGQGGRS